MSRAGEAPRRGGWVRSAPRGLLACAGAAALLSATDAGADGDSIEGAPAAERALAGDVAEPVAGDRPGTWFRSPVSGAKYVIEREATKRTKSLVAPDGSRFATVAAILESEAAALPPLERRMDAELRALAADPARAEELVNVTCIFESQPLHAAGVAARARANPRLQAELARQRRILDRIAPLRTFPGGRAPDVATAMREEAALLTDEEETTLREVRDNVRAILAQMRREALAEATAAVEREQRALAEWVRGLSGAMDLGGTVVLNARSARIPAGALLELAERFPEVIHVRPVPLATGSMDTAATTVGAGKWWSGGYAGSSGNLFASLDTGVDTGHPALKNAVAATGIYHTTASSDAGYSDSSTSGDDYQGHGTTAAGILVSTDSTYPGMASGALLLNSKCAFNSTTTGASSMYFPDGRLAADWAANNGATAFLLSFGGTGTNNGTDEFALWLDAAASSLGIPGVIAAKNYGPNSATLGYPGCAFNSLTVGNFDDAGTTSLSDDSIYSTSGRGPTSDGRQKPDIAGPGVGITTCAHDWDTTGTNFVSFSPGTTTGTSTVGPIVCGALGLLQDYGASAYPEGQKALLLTTANNQSPYKGPDNDWGYGALDCGAAYTYRGSVAEGELTSSGPTFVLLRGGSLASGGRATLVWNRQVVANGSSTPTTYYGIQDLDLYVYDEADGSEVGSSVSTVDPNEQVAVSSAVSAPVYKVLLASGTFTSSYSTEPFAVAAESSSATSVAAVGLECEFTEFADAVAGGVDTKVTVRVSNTGDVPLFEPSVELTLPSGYSITSGANPQTLSDVAGASAASATWTVRAPSGSSGAGTITVGASSSSYGETITSAELSRDQTVDADPPTGSVSIAAGADFTGTRDVTVTLSASDDGSGVSQMRVRNAGEAWGSWVAYATSFAATLTAGDEVKTFEAQFSDGVGNVSATVTDSIAYDTTGPSGTVRIEGGAVYWKSSQTTLTLDASDAASGVAEMRFSNDGTTFTAWSGYSASTGWTLPAGDGTRTVHAQFRDRAGHVSEIVNDSIVVDAVPPAGSVSIAGGAAWTSTRDVTVTLSATDSASGVADMRLSDLGANWTEWRPYETSASWTLVGDGVRAVYAQFRDAAGNVSLSASDTIGADSAPPTGSVTIAGGATFSPSAAVTLSLSASDATSGMAQMRFSNDDVTWGAWSAYASSAAWTLSEGDGAKLVYAQFSDAVGNVSASVTDTIGVDTVVPTGGVAVLGGRVATNSTSVSLDLSWFDAGSEIPDVRLSNDGATWSPWTFAAASTPWTIEPGEGEHVVHVQFRDRAGNVSQAYTDSIVIDTVAPQGTFVFAGAADYALPWEDLTVRATASDGPSGSGVAEFRSSADGGATWSAWAPLDAQGNAIVPRPAGGRDALLTLQGEIRDGAGNVAAVGTDTAFLVDAEAPDVTLVSSAKGTAGIGGDHDAVRVGLVAGDRLTLKLKAGPLVRKADARLDIDIYGPDGSLLVGGRYPSTSRKPGVTKFPAPATGEYWIVLRPAGTAAGTGVKYTMGVVNAPAKGTRARKGTATFDGALVPPAATVQFDAAAGLRVVGSLKGAATAATPTLLAPDGSVVPVAVAPGPKGSQKILPLTLTGGTGTFTLTIPSAGGVVYDLRMSTGKRTKLLEAPPTGK